MKGEKKDMIKNKEKEPEYNLKLVRLKQLEAASNALAQGTMTAARDYVYNFLGTIDEQSPAGIEMRKKIFAIQKWEEDQFKKLAEESKRVIGFLEESLYFNDGKEVIKKAGTRKLIDACYQVSLSFDLIPKE